MSAILRFPTMMGAVADKKFVFFTKKKRYLHREMDADSMMIAHATTGSTRLAPKHSNLMGLIFEDSAMRLIAQN